MLRFIYMVNSDVVLRKFTHKKSPSYFIGDKFRKSVYKRVTKKSLRLFFRGGDIISVDPIVNGFYEPEIKALLDLLAQDGFGDFLLDIGANIGLSSCQSGHCFDEVHMFEPNPNALYVLKANANIALSGTKYFIHEFGLGGRKENLKLYVPHHNWGGAFIKSDDNEYDEALLSFKDGFDTFDINNYDIHNIVVESATEKLSLLFGSLVERSLSRGVIKVDVEGLEKHIIDSILEVLPNAMEIFIVFENWKDDADYSSFFSVREDLEIQMYGFFDNKKRIESAPWWVNSSINVILGGFRTHILPVEGRLMAGDYIIKVSATD